MDDAKRGMENALRANPLEIREQYEKQLKDLQEAYGEAMPELRARRKLAALMEREDRAMGTPLVRETMARLHGDQHPGDGRARLAGAGLLHLEPQAECPCCADHPLPQSGVAEPAGRQHGDQVPGVKRDRGPSGAA